MSRIATQVTTLETLIEEHRALDARIRKLDKRPYLSAAEQQEIRTLKKLKLAKKDRIVSYQSKQKNP